MNRYAKWTRARGGKARDGPCRAERSGADRVGVARPRDGPQWRRCLIRPLSCSPRVTLVSVKFLLKLENGEPADPPAFIVAVPTWTIGDEFFTGTDEFWRILAIETDIDDLIDAGFNGSWTIEPV